MPIRQTHTYALLAVSSAAYQEIKAKLEAAGYEDQFHEEGEGLALDMHGIALVEITPPLVEASPS